MKLTLTAYVLAAMFSVTNAFAQSVSQDSVKMLQNQKEAIEISKDINDKKLKLADKENDLQKKNMEMQETAAKAQASADANTRAAADLTRNPQDKKLAGRASDAAKDAQRDAKNARKAADNVEGLRKDIDKLVKEINEKQEKLAAVGGASSPAVTSSVATTSMQQSSSQPMQSAPYSSSNAAGQTNQAAYMPNQNAYNAPANGGIVQRNIMVDSANAGNASAVAQRVLESTYKNYPQQQGQPAIIINNIIVPSDYNRPQGNNMAGQQSAVPAQDLQDYEDYKAWLHYKRGEPAAYSGAAPAPRRADRGDRIDSEEPMTREERLTFRERFGEKPARNSGMWVIPMVGIHASNFNANFQDGKYEGRSGWNAGLDFRFRVRKFFVQPGVHYFSSSLDVTQEDSVSTAPLLTGPRIHSLKAPLMLGLYLTQAKGGFFRFNIKGGIVGNYVLAVDQNDKDRFSKDNIEDFTYGLNAGFGLEFGFVTLDFSHEWGMSPLFKDNSGKSNILRATLGFKL